MRKLFVTTMLAAVIAAPTAFAATGGPAFAPVKDALTDAPANDGVAASKAHEPRRQIERMPAVRAGHADERKREAAVPPQLQAIAACESGGDPTAIGGGGLYRGKYQFSVQTWAAVGGSGDPAAAPEAEQDKRAALLYEQSGPGQWPVCAG